MTWYKSPIRPYDPVIDYDEPLKVIRYNRSEFNGSGQYSFPEPPNQPQDQFAALINILPPNRGNFEKRWGYSPWATPLAFFPYRAVDYANEAASPVVRKSVWMAPNGVTALNDDGSVFNAAPIGAVNAVDTYMAYSRSTAYFTDGLTSGQKWDGSQNGGNSGWGIEITNALAPSSATATGAVATATNYNQGGGGTPTIWQNTGSGPVGAYWASAVASARRASEQLQIVGNGFSISSSDPIISVTASVSYTITPDSFGLIAGNTLVCGITKAGLPYGPTTIYNAGVSTTAGTISVTFTNNVDGVLLPADVNAADFGAWISYYNAQSGDYTIAITACSVIVTYTTQAYGMSIDTSSSGAITLTNGRIYYYVFRNSSTSHMSDLSAPSLSTGAITSKDVVLGNIGVSVDPQVDTVWILATADGGDETLLYFVAEIPNGTTTYTDNTPELTLLANNIVQETDVNGDNIGVAENAPPPAGGIVIKHQGRLFIANGAQLYCSKNLAELTTSTGLIAGRFEEAWPPENMFDISDNAEIINALITDGTTLYIGTARHVRRLNGDSPADFQFQQIAFNEAGIISQDTIDVVYAQGTPSGCVWLTPDLRLIHSDFNTYTDIGAPIQDLLNQINPADILKARVQFFSRGAYDELTVAFNTSTTSGWNNVWAVFDMRAQTWVVWQLATITYGMTFRITFAGVPQWLLCDTNKVIQQLGPAYTSDNGTPITSLIQTPWYHFGEPTARKWLNELELLTNDPAIMVSVDGASQAADFLAPFSVVNDVVPVVSPLGPYKVFLATTGAHHRFYRATFISTTTPLTTPVLESFNYEVVPVHRL